MQDTKTHSDHNRRHSERDCHRSTTTRLWTLIYQRHQTILKFLSTAATASTRGKLANFIVRPCIVVRKVIRQYLFYFRREKLLYSTLVCDLQEFAFYESLDFFENDTVDTRAIKFIEEVNINDISYFWATDPCCGNFANICMYKCQYLHAYFRNVSTSFWH
jgi:hypothetical protein